MNSSVCGVGRGIALPNITHHKLSPYSKRTFSPHILCKTASTSTNPLGFSDAKRISSIPTSTKNVSSIPTSENSSLASNFQHMSGIPRRQAVSLLGLSLLLSLSEPAQAKDIPLFGIKKKLEKVEQEVVQEAQELVKEGEQEAEKVAEKVRETAEELEAEVTLFEGPGPVVQAGVVAGAELVGVLVASSVVNNIVGTEPSK